MANDTPFMDHAAPILAGSPDLDDQKRADLWDIFHNSKSSDALAQHLQSVEAPDEVKQQLFEAKKSTTPAAKPVDKATAALARMSAIDPKLLDLAESHPKVTALLVGAATQPEEAQQAAGASAGAGKGKSQADAKKLPPLKQPPRIDGLEHFKPIPDGHYRVQASD